MILANYAQQNRNTVRELGIAFTNPLAQTRPTMLANFFLSDGVIDGRSLGSLPHGYNTHGAWQLAIKAGGLGSTLNLTGDGTITAADALAVKLAQAAVSGSGDLTAVGGLIVQLAAAMTGAGQVSDADIKAFLNAVAALSGSGDVAATRIAFGALIAAMVGSGTVDDAALTGVGELDADLLVTGTGLSTANVGSAVWSALASANNAAGTMGEKLNDAGSASNPWTEVIESGYTAAEILRLLAAVAQGDATGLENGSPVFKGIDGTTDRVTATYLSGTRTITDRDAS